MVLSRLLLNCWNSENSIGNFPNLTGINAGFTGETSFRWMVQDVLKNVYYQINKIKILIKLFTNKPSKVTEGIPLLQTDVCRGKSQTLLKSRMLSMRSAIIFSSGFRGDSNFVELFIVIEVTLTINRK